MNKKTTYQMLQCLLRFTIYGLSFLVSGYMTKHNTSCQEYMKMITESSVYS